MPYLERQLTIDRPFYTALSGELMLPAATSKAQTLGALAHAAYTNGISELDLSVYRPEDMADRVSYFDAPPWMAGADLCVSGSEQINPKTAKLEFRPDTVRLRRGSNRLVIAASYMAPTYDGAEPRGPRLLLEGLPAAWDPNMTTLPLDRDNLPRVSHIVAELAMLFLSCPT